jgi:hypothetical protein
MHIARFTVLTVLVVFGANLRAADSIDDVLSKVLTKGQYEALDVDSMTIDQKQALIAALRSAYAAGKSESTPEPAAPRTAMEPPATNDVVESKIDGEFEGWEGETVVKLLNGQIWQQSDYYYHYHYAFMPDVLVYRSGGDWKMKVEGVDKPVGVRRIR